MPYEYILKSMSTLKEDLHSRTANGAMIFIAIVLALFVMKSVSSVIIPIMIALFLFVFINPLLNKCDKARIPKMLSMVLALLIVLLIFIAFFYAFFSVLNVLMDQEKLSLYAQRIADLDKIATSKLRQIFDMSVEDMPSILGWIKFDWNGILSSFAMTASTKFINIVGDALLIFLYLMFLILERNTILPKLAVALPENKGKQLIDIVGRMNRQTAKYLLLKVIISAATGIMYYITAVLAGVNFPLVWGLLAFLLNFIPTIGSIVVTALAIFMTLVQFMPEWNRVIFTSLMFIAIEMILGNIVDPKIQGVQLNISPLVILISLAVWGYVWGLVGMFLAVPLTSIMQVICSNVQSLHPIAVLLSSGTGYAREEERRRRKADKRRGDSSGAFSFIRRFSKSSSNENPNEHDNRSNQ